VEVDMKVIPWTKAKIQEMVELWNDELGNHFPMRVALFEQNSFKDTNILLQGSKIVIDEKTGKVIGFIVSKVRQENKSNIYFSNQTGWIQVILVHSDYKRKGIGHSLLEIAESALQNYKVKKISLGSDPFHYFPGIPEQFSEVKNWFEKRGYIQTGTEYDLIREFSREKEEDLPQVPGVEFRLLHWLFTTTCT
jgi:ribosomal protein S18 acetylase RimI-like enzyme